MTTEPIDAPIAGRLMRTRLTTRLLMMLERIWPLVLPLLIVACLYLAASWFGLFRVIPEAARLVLLGVFGLGALAALLPLRAYRRPTDTEIDRRIELSNKLAHTPVQAQKDRLASTPDDFAEALWREHQSRMAARLTGLDAGMPRTHVPDRDPWGLRAIAPLLALAALAFSYGPHGGRIDDALNPQAGIPITPPRIDAWITPPAYTGKAPIFLTAEANAASQNFSVPASSAVTVRISGGAGDETLSFLTPDGLTRVIEPKGADKPADGAVAEPAPAASPKPDGPLQFESSLAANGELQLKSGDSVLRQWVFNVIPDRPPTIAFADDPRRSQSGALELQYRVDDDYGATSATGVLTLDEKQAPSAHPLYGAPDLPLTAPRRGANPPVGKTTKDLTEHVWSGAKVKLLLKAVDGANQEATSEPRAFRMPERIFGDPLARALIEERRMLALDANSKPRVLQLMDAITLRPEDTIPSSATFLALTSARSRLEFAQTDDELRGVVDYLWQIALGIENGGMTDAQKALQRAAENLKAALDRGASDEEIDKLMKELRQAMNDYLREFAKRAQKDPNMAQNMPPNAQQLRQGDLDRMLDQIEKMAKGGSQQQARDMLSQLQQMMENLQAARDPSQGQNGQQGEMQRQMNKLGEIMRRQQQMMNETFQAERGQRQNGMGDMDQQGQEGDQQPGQDGDQQQGQQGQQGQNGQSGQGNQGGQMSPEEFAETMKRLQKEQGDLQKDLDGLSESLKGMGMQPGKGFGEAGQQMGQAQDALGGQEGERATGHQGRALEALRRGAQDMMQQMQQAMEGDQGDSQEGGRRQQNADRDPLGRPRATTGPEFGDTTKVPDEIDVQRAREILEEIRKRLGNALSPELERSYLERLLELN